MIYVYALADEFWLENISSLAKVPRPTEDAKIATGIVIGKVIRLLKNTETVMKYTLALDHLKCCRYSALKSSIIHWTGFLKINPQMKPKGAIRGFIQHKAQEATVKIPALRIFSETLEIRSVSSSRFGNEE
ncbi:MAG: hypothetical protein Tsb0021_09580 [Chlamydiales bacterium]